MWIVTWSPYGHVVQCVDQTTFVHTRMGRVRSDKPSDFAPGYLETCRIVTPQKMSPDRWIRVRDQHLRQAQKRIALNLDQIFSARPMLGYGNYRGPLPGIYMCGSGTHPGGGVTGAPGHNAAREILIDFKKRKLRRIA